MSDSNELKKMMDALRKLEAEEQPPFLPEPDEQPLALRPDDMTLENGDSVYSILSELNSEEEIELEIERRNLPQDLVMANLRLERELQAIQKNRRLNPPFEGETSPGTEKNSANSQFGGTLALNGVMSDVETGVPGSSEKPARAVFQTVNRVSDSHVPQHQASAHRAQESPRKPKARGIPASGFPVPGIPKGPPVQQTQDVKLTKSVKSSGGSMADLSGYKDLSQAPFSLGEGRDEYSAHTESEMSFERGQMATSTFSSPAAFPEMSQEVDTEFSGNVKTLIRLVNELPDGVTKQTGAQIIRLTMEAMGISMEDVLSEAQSAQSEMLDAVRANIKKIEEYKTVIRKLETDIRYYQGKANELSEIIDLFILSNTSGAKVPSVDDLNH